jgi:hypothetical protein
LVKEVVLKEHLKQPPTPAEKNVIIDNCDGKKGKVINVAKAATTAKIRKIYEDFEKGLMDSLKEDYKTVTLEDVEYEPYVHVEIKWRPKNVPSKKSKEEIPEGKREKDKKGNLTFLRFLICSTHYKEDCRSWP